MNKLSAIVVDDEENNRNLMIKLIRDFIPDVEVIGTASNSKEGLLLAEQKLPDILFLDVEMPGGTGLSLAESLSYEPYIIFVTAHEHYAIKAIKAGAFDYLLKPVDIDDLTRTASKILEKETQRKRSNLVRRSANKDVKHTISIPVKEGVLYLKESDILYAEADGSYCSVYMRSAEKWVLSKNLKELTEQIKSDCFYRCHASFLINLNDVQMLNKADGLSALMSDGKKVPISRKYRDEFNEVILNFRNGS